MLSDLKNILCFNNSRINLYIINNIYKEKDK